MKRGAEHALAADSPVSRAFSAALGGNGFDCLVGHGPQI